MATRKAAAEKDAPWEKEVSKPAAKADKLGVKRGPANEVPAAKKTAAKKPIASSDEEKKPLGPPPEGLFKKGQTAPKNLGEAVDLMKTAELEASRISKLADAEDAKRKWLKAWIIESLPKAGVTAAAGKLGFSASMVKKETPRAENWPVIYKNIVDTYNQHVKKKTGMEDAAFAMLQKRLGEATIKELWESGQVVAGISKFTYTDLSVTKV